MKKEIRRIIENIRKWDMDGSLPFLNTPEVPFVDLVYIFNRDVGSDTIDAIQQAFKRDNKP